MAKLTAWLVTLIGILLVLPLIFGVVIPEPYNGWLIALAVLVIGVSKLIRNYSKKKR